jgi:hypothetical protein
MSNNRKLALFQKALLFAVGLLISGVAVTTAAEGVIIQLRNGDRITGTIVAESTNQLVISTTWAKELAIPLTEISSRQKAEVVVVSPGAPLLQGTNSVAQQTNALAQLSIVQTNAVVQQTNAASADTNVIAQLTPPPPKRSPLFKAKSWHGKIDIGTDLGFSEVSRELYYARAKIIYTPESTPDARKTIAERFKNTFDYQATYGRNDEVVSANRMDAISKTDFDVGRRIFVYNLIGTGYDEIRRINFQYEVGPGIGYRLFMRSNFVMNAETGFNYQMQSLEKTVGGHKVNDKDERFSIRLAEDATWSISKRVTLDEKLELFPSIDLTGFRLRFESNLRYSLWESGNGHSILLTLTLLDLYDTQLATGVSNNDLQIRSSVGISF